MRKQFGKLVVGILALSMTAALFTGCSSQKKDSSKWVIGTNAEFPPFEYISKADGVIDNYAGIDMELIKLIAEDNDKTVTINNMEFDSLIISLNNKQVDACIAGMTVTDERKEEVDFSTPYYVATQVMIVNEGSDIEKATDMKDKTIAVVQGYTGETVVKELGYEYEAFKKGTEAIEELKNKKCDVVVIDSATAAAYLNENKGLAIVEDEDAFSSEEYAIAVKKGDKETLDAINKSIEKFKEDGTIDKLAEKYAEAGSTAE